MVSASCVLPHMSSDFFPLEVLLLEGVMLVIIVILDGAGLSRVVDRYQKNAAMLRRRNWHPHTITMIFAGAILLMLNLHIRGMHLGSCAEQGRPDPQPSRFKYFNTNSYTTVGYGKFLLPGNWRELAPSWQFPVCSLLHGRPTRGSMWCKSNTIQSQHCGKAAKRRSFHYGVRTMPSQRNSVEVQRKRRESITDEPGNVATV
jgi:hypothetical protein